MTRLTRNDSVATALSHLGRARRRFGRTIPLARLSLMLVSMAFVSSCIVADPPEYDPPQRTPPILDLRRALPSVLDVLVIDRRDTMDANDKIEVTVPVRSDDQGTELIAALYYDYTYTGSNPYRVSTKLDPGKLSDTDRQINITLDLSRDRREVSQGCHVITLLVSHYDNWDLNDGPVGPNAKYDTAMGTWWVNIDPPAGSNPYTLQNCPNRAEIQKGNQ